MSLCTHIIKKLKLAVPSCDSRRTVRCSEKTGPNRQHARHSPPKTTSVTLNAENRLHFPSFGSDSACGTCAPDYKKCNTMFRATIVIVLVPHANRHFRHSSDLNLLHAVWCICTTQRMSIGACRSQDLRANVDWPLKMHCQDCALVTSSGHLLRSRLGARIDQTECVIRMNDAPTRGFGRDVGNRTSLRVIAHSSIQRILRNRHDLLNVSQGTVFIFWGPSSYMRRDGKGQVYNNLQLLSQVLPRLKAFMIARHQMLQFDELFKQETGKDRKISNTWLSTGWFTMTIALELCDRINVYGMVPPDFCRDPNHPSVPYHYYEPLGPDECTMYLSHERGRKGSHHRFITEKRVFKNWARTFNIHFFQPDWKPESLAINHPETKPVF
ncbi:alpha-N-acetylgalactosaminide alpha-2,6-sialyltransferase 5 [Echinops telfairi]|uniref:Alpha-N-acetylgalactosaminide alpha-2,6-sialyltransferase 5 n=1 Tax=Echinops telfairi TaxID=9371 RepID=A0ABM0IG88_ECHTE|nr:alpha-N-acetylgalactosaminide alpha-2,6-sialyltransferase 5 [Echinops telfairi]